MARLPAFRSDRAGAVPLAPFAVVFAAVGVALVPWTVWLSASLPMHHRTHNWALAWAGFDAGLAAFFLAAGYAAWRRRPWLPAIAGATGALLLADAWFDAILESRSTDLDVAVVEAAVAELPLAALCFAVAFATARAGRPERDRA